MTPAERRRQNNRASYAVKAQAKRAEEANQAELLAQVQARCCACGCGLPVTVDGEKYAPTCKERRKAEADALFGRL